MRVSLFKVLFYQHFIKTWMREKIKKLYNAALFKYNLYSSLQDIELPASITAISRTYYSRMSKFNIQFHPAIQYSTFSKKI